MFDFVLNMPLKQFENKMSYENYEWLLINRYKIELLLQTLVTKVFQKIWLIFTVKM